jgi:hypothetical protein
VRVVARVEGAKELAAEAPATGGLVGRPARVDADRQPGHGEPAYAPGLRELPAR